MSSTQQRGKARKPGGRLRQHRMRWLAAILALAALLGSVAAAPAANAETTAEGVRPVLIVGGTFQTQAMLEQITFLDDDYDVHRFPLRSWNGFWWLGGVPGTASMVQSAQALQARVTQILNATNADQIDIVGISQGTLVARYYIKNLGGLDRVAGLVSYGGPHYGIRWVTGDLVRDQFLITSCLLFQPPVCGEIFYDQTPGDTAFLMALNQPDPTPGDVDYYHIYTESDLATSDEAIPLPGAVNVSLQDACPGRKVVHADLTDGAAQELVRAALARQPLVSTCP